MRSFKGIFAGIGLLSFALVLIVVFREGRPFSPFACRLYGFPDSQAARNISLALHQYALDHKGHYPAGRSSTEIFQKLLDEDYLSDSKIFYLAMPNKVEARGLKLIKSKNVCWDITCGMTPSGSDDVPLVFSTGYRLLYQAGGSAIPLSKFSPSFQNAFLHWWDSDKYPIEHICVSYDGDSTRQIPLGSDGVALNVIPTDFDPRGKTYRQLTPDGELPP